MNRNIMSNSNTIFENRNFLKIYATLRPGVFPNLIEVRGGRERFVGMFTGDEPLAFPYPEQCF